MRSLLGRAARLALGFRSFLAPGKRAVFVYHDVSTPSEPQHSPQYSTHPEVFAHQLDFLQAQFELVPLDEIVAANGPATRRKPLAAVTFDDGFTSVAARALPMLRERRIPFTLFVNGRAVREGRLDYLAQYEPPAQSTRFYLTPDELKALARDGVQIGNHTTSHRPLTGLTDADLDQEIAANKAYLEELAGTPVRHLALPYGKKEHYDARALARCFATGHTHVHSTNPTIFDERDLSGFTHRPVPRIGLRDESAREILFLVNRPLLRSIDL